MKHTECISEIHPTAIIDDSAEIGEGVVIGPYTVIGAHTRIGDGTKLDSHVVIEPYTRMGNNNRVMSGAVLGGLPQDNGFKGEESYLDIGDGNIIREFVTIHRASGEGRSTTVGSNNMLMAYCHIGHNCKLGNGITMANSAVLGGHTQIEDKVVLGGLVGIHQKTRIGMLAMVGGFSKVVMDIPPYSLSDGRPAKVYDLNVIGLRRNGFGPKERASIREAYRLLYRSELNLGQALEAIEKDIEPSKKLQYLIDFLRKVRKGNRGRQLEAPSI